MQIYENNMEVQEDGTVVLPAALVEELGGHSGDTLHAIQTPNGILVAPREVLINRLLDEIGEDLTAKGFTFEELLADSKQIRQDIYDEKYSPGRE